MDAKNTTEVFGVTEGQYGFSRRYNESFIGLKTQDNDMLKKILDYLHQMNFMFYVESKKNGRSTTYVVSIRLNEESMKKLQDLFGFVQQFENPKVTTTEELVRVQ